MQAATRDRSKVWTVDDYLQLGEMSTPCQLINGELVMSPAPTPLHQLVLGNLYDVFKAVARRNEDITLFSPIDLYVNYKSVFQPDLVYIAKHNKKILTAKGIEGTPDIIVEILSPTNLFIDRNTKKRTYREMGIKEYWIVDPANKTLEIYLHDQKDDDVPYLHVIEEGPVKSTVIPDLSFDVKLIF